MIYEKPLVIVYDEDTLVDLELNATSSCHCTMAGSRVHY